MVFDNIQKLCNERNISITKLEREVGLSNGSIGKWRKSSPTILAVKAVADYFNVSVDSLLRTS